MQVMILAAGRGERMRPLTDQLPKPLLQAGGKPLIVWQLDRLIAVGFSNFVINHAWLGTLIEEALGDGHDFYQRFPIDTARPRATISIRYSAEQSALETAGGIARALPLLCPSAGQEVFAVVNGDVFSDFPMHRLWNAKRMIEAGLGCSWSALVPNPAHHPEGDFSLLNGRLANDLSSAKLTFSGIGVYHRSLFSAIKLNEPAKLGPLLRQGAQQGSALGEYFDGYWQDIGTVERLQALDQRLSTVDARRDLYT